MQSILRREDSHSRKYWWVVLIIMLCAGSGYFMVGPTGAPEPDLSASEAGLATEQSLESIDVGLQTLPSPGAPMKLSMEGAYKKRDEASSTQTGSLYVSPAANGAPVAVAESASASTGETLAAALKNVGKKPSDSSSSTANKGWGNAAVRTGFTPPKANFKMSGLSGSAGGGGGSGASFSVGQRGNTPFGTGASDPGASPTVGTTGMAGGVKIRGGGRNKSYDMLKQVEQVAQKAAMSTNRELAANQNARGFDGATAKSDAPSGISAAASIGKSGVSGEMDGVPENLKLSDPTLQKRELKVPEVKKQEEVKDPQADMERQIMMMLVSAAISGIAGPMFGAIGMGLASSMGADTSKMNVNVGQNFNSTSGSTTSGSSDGG